jgi:transcriptional regulator with XRE-family HTH domain
MPEKNRLREQRERSRLTIYEVAKLLEVTPGTVSKHESNSRGLSDDMIRKYAELYKCETHELFFGD